MRTSLITSVLATVVVLGTATAAPGSSPGDRRDGTGSAPSACGAGSSVAHCSGIFDLTSDRSLRTRLAAR